MQKYIIQAKLIDTFLKIRDFVQNNIFYTYSICFLSGTIRPCFLILLKCKNVYWFKGGGHDETIYLILNKIHVR